MEIVIIEIQTQKVPLNEHVLLGARGNRADIAAVGYVECHLQNANVFHRPEQRMSESGDVCHCQQQIEVGSTLAGHP